MAHGPGRPDATASADLSLEGLACALTGRTGTIEVWLVGEWPRLPDYGLR